MNKIIGFKRKIESNSGHTAMSSFTDLISIPVYFLIKRNTL